MLQNRGVRVYKQRRILSRRSPETGDGIGEALQRVGGDRRGLLTRQLPYIRWAVHGRTKSFRVAEVVLQSTRQTIKEVPVFQLDRCQACEVWRYGFESHLELMNDKEISNRQNASESGRELARLNIPLHLMACMLYWAEGGKTEGSFNFSNSDVNMCKIIVKFLKIYFPNVKITLKLQGYLDHGLTKQQIIKYWLDELELEQINLSTTLWDNHKVHQKITTSKRKKKLK